VHLLMVHGVGRHDPLSSLLHVYQSFRADLRSVEAPILFEDRIPDWRLDAVSEDAAPPYLKLVPRFPDPTDDLEAVYVYEVNYSTVAGLVRKNHPLDLTTLFVGFDMAVYASRQKLSHPNPTIEVGDTVRLAKCLQRVSGVFVAATVPVLGLPSILLSKYTQFVATYKRFFEDVATFALDKNGEQLIAAHLDRTVENIVRSKQFAGSAAEEPRESVFVIAAHSLGSIVVHNHLVRKWTSAADRGCVPSRLLTFGSPIGLITWLWLLLDFPDLAFDASRPAGQNYFCWTPASNAGKAAKPLTWINVVNGLDPIATAFPTEAADMSRPVEDVRASLYGGVAHRFCGTPRLSSAGVAHMDYMDDRGGFIEILLRMARLREDDPLAVKCEPPDRHWSASRAVLARLHVMVMLLALSSAAAYCGLVAWAFRDVRVMWSVLWFASPRVAIAGLAAWQRFLFGGPTKRIPDETIAAFAWRDATSFPYRIRRVIGPLFGARREVDLTEPPRIMAMRLLKLLAFAPALVAVMVPIVLGVVLTRQVPDPDVSIFWYVFAVLLFTAYVIFSAGTELVAAWRRVLQELGVGAASAKSR
jgi:hypothetical protein